MLRARDVALAQEREKSIGAFADAAKLRPSAIESMLHVRLSHGSCSTIICELDCRHSGVN
jgi:hypothetical protein